MVLALKYIKMKKVIITAKGASLKTNNWEEGQEINCHENLATDFIERGLATDPDAVKEEPKAKEPKAKK